MPHSVLLLALMAAGCGGGPGRPVALTRPADPVWCPTRSAPVRSQQSMGNRASDPSFDTRTVLGGSLTHAMAAARGFGCSVRVIERDGHSIIITAEFDPARVDVTLSDGVITSVGTY